MTSPFKSIDELLAAFPDEEACITHLEHLRWKNQPISPFDPSSVVYVCPNNTYKCKNSGKYFNVRSNTIFEDSKIPLRKWLIGYYLYLASNENITGIELSRKIGSTQLTARSLIQKFKHALSQ